MEKTQQLAIGIEGFDSSKLRHTETNEKNPLPDKDGEYLLTLWYYCMMLQKCFSHVLAVAAEKTHIEFISGVEQFDKTTMKHAQTSEKNPLPAIEGIFKKCIYTIFSNLHAILLSKRICQSFYIYSYSARKAGKGVASWNWRSW